MTTADTMILQPTSRTLRQWFFLFCSIHLVIWSVLPSWLVTTIPLDTAEGIVWGREWQWGYYKHPPLAAWLTNIFYLFQSHPGFSVYLLSQLALIISFCAVWRFSQRFLSPVAALLSVFSLVGIYFYSFPAIQFNPNILLLPLWAWSTLKFYEALHDNKFKDWLLLGVLSGLSLLAKYESLLLLASMFIFILVNDSARKSLKNSRFYLAVIVLIVIVAPHVIWLFKHDFLSINYMLDSVQSTDQSSAKYFEAPVNYLIAQAIALVPACVLLSLLVNWRGQKYWRNSQASKMLSDVIPAQAGIQGTKSFSLEPFSNKIFALFQKQFLLIVCSGPFLITLLLTFAGITIKTYWTIPYYSFIGTVFLSFLQPLLSIKKIKNYMMACAAIFIFAVIGSISALYYLPLVRGSTLHLNYPAADIANFVTQQWNEKYHKPVSYLVGTTTITSNVGAYSQDHPSVFINNDKKISPWINEQRLRQLGAIFLWEITNDSKGFRIPRDVLQHYPGLQFKGIYYFKPKTSSNSITGVTLAVGVLPPSEGK